jgi:response regulator RpfG family c-di-GMP phosphodiesterase
MKDQSIRALMVDDSPDDVCLLTHHIKKNGYGLIHERVEDAHSMKKALQEKQWDIIICDYTMPQFSVPAAIAILKESKADIPLIIVSGTSHDNIIEECMRLGARDYVSKNNLSRRCPVIERELETANVRNKCKWLKDELQGTIENFQNVFKTTMQFMVSAIEARDPYKRGHQLRTANLAYTIAAEMGLHQEIKEGIHMAGSIHDIGNLTIPAEILAKPSKLTDIEFSMIKEHCQNGYEMLKNVETAWPLAQVIYQHHERIDGSGYPLNLKNDEIIMEARILAVSDVVESMASYRTYRPALGIESALHEIKENRGILYDAIVADTCLKLFREKGYQLSPGLGAC